MSLVDFFFNSNYRDSILNPSVNKDKVEVLKAKQGDLVKYKVFTVVIIFVFTNKYGENNYKGIVIDQSDVKNYYNKINQEINFTYIDEIITDPKIIKKYE